MLSSSSTASRSAALSRRCRFLLLPSASAVLACRLHLNAASKALHAYLIWMHVWQPWPQVRSNHACSLLPVPCVGAGRPLRSTDHCRRANHSHGFAGAPLPCMQTAKGETAKGCTMEEWKAVMAKFQAAAEKVVRSAEWRGKLGRVRPLWSFDNDRIHTNVFVLATLKINKRNRPPLPANSPDMHGVVERCIQRLKRAFHKWLYRHPADRTMEQYQQALRELFFTNKKVASRKVIDSQVLFMPEVYAAIASPSVKGDHPPKKYK